MVGENVYAYSQNAYFCHVGFNADWGVASLDHRANIMNTNAAYPDFREVGISCVPTANSKVGPQVVTQDFGTPAAAGTAYLVGVVYNDSEAAARTAPAREFGGVTVTLTAARTTPSPRPAAGSSSPCRPPARAR